MSSLRSWVLIMGLVAGWMTSRGQHFSETNSTPGTQGKEDATIGMRVEADVITAPPTNEVSLLQSNANGLRIDFRGAPLDLVLNYLSEAAGFVIDKQTEVRGTVDMWSKEKVTREEAIELLNSALRRNGYAVTRKGRILTVVSLDSAKTADLEIISGNDPDKVTRSDEVVTQIIPVRYASAAQLVSNLTLLLPSSTSLSVNESANSLILVATKTDIRRVLRIVHTLDTSLAGVTSVRVFPLRFADSKQLAAVIQQLFAPQTGQGGGMNQRGQFAVGPGTGAFPGPGGGGPFGGDFAAFGPGDQIQGGRDGGTGGSGRNAANNRGSGRNTAAMRVVATSDDYSNSLIVSAAPELMATVVTIVQQIDQPVADITELRVFRLTNADPVGLAEQLVQLFPEQTGSVPNQSQGQIRFGGPPGFGGGGGGTQAGTSERSRKQSRVLAVPDVRTSSLLVSAAGALMPEIAAMIEQLDANPARREVVKVWDLHNANPRDINQVLQDLFNRNGTMRNNNSLDSLAGENDPLTARQTQQQNNTGAGYSTFGNLSGGGAAVGGVGGQGF